MPAVYCELSNDYKSAITLPKYVTYNTGLSTDGCLLIKNPFVGSIMHGSDRIWVEDNSSIRYAKHRWQDPSNAAIDLAEFMWVKLKSVKV